MPEPLTPAEISAWQPCVLPDDGKTALQRARERMRLTDQWAGWQTLGRRMAIGCVALEITQRCNLDCDYCYLSESSEALKDIPLAEIMRRIDLIGAHYGPGTDVQVTGGDPTLRRRDELVAIIQAIRERGMRSSLFTNGIKATRDLLAELSAAGLEDVAFHVDMTQQRKGYCSEHELNEIRVEYIERARGLPLSVFFNTTVFPGNFHEVPELVRFFVAHSDVVRTCSFQIGAETGRGIGADGGAPDLNGVMDAIGRGAGGRLTFDAVGVGHAQCNRYAFGLVIGGRVYDFFADREFVATLLDRSSQVVFDRARPRRTLLAMTRFLLLHPHLLAGFAGRAVRLAWQVRRDLVASRGRVGKLSFFVHNFQSAAALDRERCESCSFMVMTPEGPLSMCVHNAKRDHYLLVPAKVAEGVGIKFWNPVTGDFHASPPGRLQVALSRKTARGRARA